MTRPGQHRKVLAQPHQCGNYQRWRETMMDLHAIDELSRQAARRAKREGKQPVVFTEEQLARAQEDDNTEAIRRIPNLGKHLPKGWERVRLEKQHGVYLDDNEGYGAFFVDGSGFGRPGEPALTLSEFIDKLKPGLGYAIVESGQFQVKIGVYALNTQH